MKFELKIGFVISGLILIATLSGCALHGTGTGNPNNANLSTPSASVSELVASETCSTVVRCHADASYSDCVTASAMQTTFTARLGLSSTGLMTLEDIGNAENAGRLQRNSSELSRCREQIRLTDCASSEALESFDARNSDAYLRLSSILKTSCMGVFLSP